MYILTDDMNSGKRIVRRADIILQNATNRIRQQQQQQVLPPLPPAGEKENVRHSNRKRMVNRRLLFHVVILFNIYWLL